MAMGLSSSCGTRAMLKGFDVVVIGGGHAGCEAASAAARSGARTALLTQRADTIGEMSCNPSIGGIGKGHLCREVDALGGIMGRAIDKGGIHFRMLNRRKGPAVWGPRAQADRNLYRSAVRDLIGEIEGLTIVEGSAEDVVFDNEMKVRGVLSKIDGTEELLECRAAVITTGTFLRGRCYLGHEVYEAGRHTRDGGTEPPSNALAKTLEETLALPLSRLKTGTPPRLKGSTIDWERCIPQPSEVPFAFSFENDHLDEKRELITCYRTNTNEATHEIVMNNAHTLAPPSTTGIGPRYCPSIYKKVERFGDRSSHGVWLEPEGLDTDLVYPNGLSGAFPLHVQQEIVHSIVGLENAEFVQAGYDVEYDFVDPTALGHDLGVDRAKGLYLAGQICGTTGYEEAAALGIVAGANAGLFAQGRSRFVLGRDEAYVGVLVDDLVTRGTSEPYRMFTSRAEYRLHLRADNADLRLTEKAHEHGLIDSTRRERCLLRKSQVEESMERLEALKFPVVGWYDKVDFTPSINPVKTSGQKKSAKQILSMPNAELDAVEDAIAELVASPINKDGFSYDPVPPRARDTVAALAKYDTYLSRQLQEVAVYKRNEQLYIPPDLEYDPLLLPALSGEEREKLSKTRPKTFAEASKIPGITPASLVYLYNHVSSRKAKAKDGDKVAST